MSVCNSKDDSHDIQYLARMRQAVKENIHLTRKEKLQLQRERNAQLKKMLDADEKSDSPTLYEVRVSIDKQLRDETQMKKEKRGRVFIAIGNEGCKTLDGLKKRNQVILSCIERRAFIHECRFTSCPQRWVYFLP